MPSRQTLKRGPLSRELGAKSRAQRKSLVLDLMKPRRLSIKDLRGNRINLPIWKDLHTAHVLALKSEAAPDKGVVNIVLASMKTRIALTDKQLSRPERSHEIG
jgi:hypothetical protein